MFSSFEFRRQLRDLDQRMSTRGKGRLRALFTTLLRRTGRAFEAFRHIDAAVARTGGSP
ncbi:hypothetical protein WMF38_04345 [Sorangium sp. So ce118]